jgi:streptogramin lyase
VDGQRRDRLRPRFVSRIDPTTGDVLATIRVGATPFEVAVGEGSVWVSNDDDTVPRIHPDAEVVVEEITTEQGPQIIVEVDGFLWVSTTDIDAVQAIDPATDEIVATVETPVAPDGLAFDGRILWVATEIGPRVVGIDVAIQEVVAGSTVADNGLNANQVMAFEDGSPWLPILNDGVVLRVAPPATIAE